MSSDQAEATAPPQSKCDHKFVHFESIRFTKGDVVESTYYVRIDRFYCERCLHEEEKRRETYSRDVPEWYHKG